jgi:LPXTG-site transpeptidase (sortase) family protein
MNSQISSRAAAFGQKRLRERWWFRLVVLVLLSGAIGYIAYLVFMACESIYVDRKQAGYLEQLAAQNPAVLEPESSVAADGFLTASDTAQYQSQLAALQARADAFEAQVHGKTLTPICRLVIPAIDLDVVVIEGDQVHNDAYLRQGPGHWPEKPIPGQGGNFVVSGHRTTWSAPFHKLDELIPGDEIIVYLPYAIIKYVVTETLFVAGGDTSHADYQSEELISLVACHPLHSSRQRIVVRAEMVGFQLTAGQE